MGPAGSRTCGRMKLRTYREKTRNARREGKWWRHVLESPAEKKASGSCSRERYGQEPRGTDGVQELEQARESLPTRDVDFWPLDGCERTHFCCLKPPSGWSCYSGHRTLTQLVVSGSGKWKNDWGKRRRKACSIFLSAGVLLSRCRWSRSFLTMVLLSVSHLENGQSYSTDFTELLRGFRWVHKWVGLRTTSGIKSVLCQRWLLFLLLSLLLLIMFIIICQNLHAFLIIVGPIWIISFAYVFMEKKKIKRFILQTIINS